MNRGNKLWEGHRMMLPEIREKAVVTCGECIFLVNVIGRSETRTGCVAGIHEYRALIKRVPASIHAVELLRRVGKKGLNEITARGAGPDTPGCGNFRPRPGICETP